MSNSDVYLFTIIRTQRWHVNRLVTVLCETVTTVSLTAPHTTVHRHQVTSVTDYAGHQQTWLLVLAISRWLRVWDAAIRHLLSILCNRWAALTVRMTWNTIACTNARLTCALLAGTDHTDSNSYRNTHTPTQRPPIDKQCRSAIIISRTVICHLKDPEMTTVTECRQAIHHMQITPASFPCHNGRIWPWPLRCPLTFLTPPARQ